MGCDHAHTFKPISTRDTRKISRGMQDYHQFKNNTKIVIETTFLKLIKGYASFIFSDWGYASRKKVGNRCFDQTECRSSSNLSNLLVVPIYEGRRVKRILPFQYVWLYLVRQISSCNKLLQFFVDSGNLVTLNITENSKQFCLLPKRYFHKFIITKSNRICIRLRRT